jgi:hypothetical protein
MNSAWPRKSQFAASIVLGLALIAATPMGAPLALAQPAASSAPASSAAPVQAPSSPAPVITTTAAPVPAPAQVSPPPAGKAPMWLVLTVIGLLTVFGLLALGFINAALGKGGWSLASALSEEVSLPVKDATGALVMVNGAPVLAPVLVASTSRLIALYGLFGILLLYLGVGGFVLYDVGTGQALPTYLGEVEKFLVAGLTLFAPYLVNQFASVFSSLAPKG